MRKTLSVVVVLLGAVLGLWLTDIVSAMSFVEDFHIDDISGKAYLLADVTNDGKAELLIGSDQSVHIMQCDGKVYQDSWQVRGIGPGVVSLAAGDIDNDSWVDVLVGTGQAGSIRIYGFDGTEFVRKGETEYLWAPVQTIQIADVDGNGWGDILAVNRSGSAYLFQWNGLAFRTVWYHPSSEGRVKYLTTADINGDGVNELVYTLQEGKVTVLKWGGNGLTTVWENYPWGTVNAVTLTDVDGDGIKDIVITTKQKMLYAYGWNGSAFELKTHLYDPAVSFDEAVGGDLDGDGRGEIVAVKDGVVTTLKVSREKIQVVGTAGFIDGPHRLRLEEAQKRLLLFDINGTLHSLRPVEDNFLVIEVQDKELKLTRKPLWAGGQPLLPVRDVADLLGLTVFWDDKSGRLTALRGQTYAVLKVGSDTMNVSGQTVVLSTSPAIEKGTAYVPLEFIDVFAAAVDWDETARHLRIIP